MSVADEKAVSKRARGSDRGSRVVNVCGREQRRAGSHGRHYPDAVPERDRHGGRLHTSCLADGRRLRDGDRKYHRSAHRFRVDDELSDRIFIAE
ncbi:MAG: hypothetical protein M3290_07125 [Actinomycetota bacterium]|nr:hypothetical protein [Actinomycetota bacterium]